MTSKLVSVLTSLSSGTASVIVRMAQMAHIVKMVIST